MIIENPPHPDFWDAIARRLAALLGLLRATAPDAFGAIARSARARLVLLTALVRRYILLLAAGIAVPPPRQRAPEHDPAASTTVSHGGYRFPLGEPLRGGGRTRAEADPPSLQWALLFEAARRLAAVMADPLPHARRYARAMLQPSPPVLREIAVPWHALRQLHAADHMLAIRLDAAARPEAWEGIDTS